MKGMAALRHFATNNCIEVIGVASSGSRLRFCLPAITLCTEIVSAVTIVYTSHENKNILLSTVKKATTLLSRVCMVGDSENYHELHLASGLVPAMASAGVTI